MTNQVAPDRSEIASKAEKYEAYVKTDPKNPLLWLSLGDLYHQLSRFDDAISCYERSLTESPNLHAARSRIAAVMISQHRFEAAEDQLRQLLNDSGKDPALLHNLGISLFYQERWQDAHDCFAEAEAAGLRAPTNYAYASRALHHLGKMPEAIDACRKWIETQTTPQSKGYLALLEMDEGNMAVAHELALEALSQAPDQTEAAIVVGNAAVERQEMAPAAARFNGVLRQEPDNGRAWLGIGLVHLYEEKHDLAIEALEKASRLMPRNSGTIVALGWARLASRDAVGAERTFRHAIEVDRAFGEAHGGLATALAFQAKVDPAREAIKTAMRLDKANFGAAFAHTVLLKMHGKDQQAQDLLAKLLQQRPAPSAPALIDHLLLHARHAKKPIPSESEGQTD